jgi:hypothetical protein
MRPIEPDNILVGNDSSPTYTYLSVCMCTFAVKMCLYSNGSIILLALLKIYVITIIIIVVCYHLYVGDLHSHA